LQLTGNGIPVQTVKVTCWNEFDTFTATTIPVEYNRQNKCIVVVLAWYTTLVLKFDMPQIIISCASVTGLSD
jgi:hypothetical protein